MDKKTNNFLVSYEYNANRLAAKVMAIALVLLLPVDILLYLRILGEKSNDISIVLFVAIILMLVPILLILVFKVEKLWIKYLFISEIIIILGLVNIFSDNSITIVWIIGLSLASIYLSKPLTTFSYIVSMIVQAISGILAVRYYPQLHGNLWTEEIFKVGIQLLIIYPLYKSLSILTKNELNTIIRYKNEQNILFSRSTSIVQKAKEVSAILVDKSDLFSIKSENKKKHNENVRSFIRKLIDKAEENTIHIEDAYQSISLFSEKLNDSSEEFFLLADLTKKSANINQELKSCVKNTVIEMNNISINRNSSKEVIYRLAKMAKEVKRIVYSISEIASDTQLVALKAEVESAKSGEYGKSFSVVAIEIGNLAELNKTAAQQINSLVENINNFSTKIIETIDIGVQLVNSGIETFNTLDEVFDEFSNAGKCMEDEIQRMSVDISDIASNGNEVKNIIETIRNINNNSIIDYKEVAASSEKEYLSMDQILSLSSDLKDISNSLLQISDTSGQK